MNHLFSFAALAGPRCRPSAGREPRPGRWRLGLLGLLLMLLAGPALAGVGPQAVQNGRFALTPGTGVTNGTFTAYSLLPGTDLGAWYSSRPYVNTDSDPARGSLSVQIDNANYTGSAVQRTYSDYSAPSATNAVSSTTNINTFLLYKGTTASADIWYQNISVRPSTAYTVTFWASNAAPVGSTGTAPQLQLRATYANNGTVQAATLLSEATRGTTITLANETTAAGGDIWTQYTYTFTTAANTTNVELRLTDPVTATAGTSNLVAITAIVARANSADVGANFSCDGMFYQIRQTDVATPINSVAAVANTTAAYDGYGNSTRLYSVNRGTATYTTSEIRDLGTTVNGLSYEPNDGYMYALTYRGNANGTTGGDGAARIAQPSSYVEVIKIGKGGVESLGFVANLPVDQWAAGTVDRGKTLYLKSQATGSVIYKLDLTKSPVTVTTLNLVTSANATANVDLFDMAFDPVTSQLFGADYPGTLYSIDPNTGVTTTIANPAITAANADPLGSFFFDIAGNLYAYGNGNLTNTAAGAFYSINKATGVATNIAATVDRSTNSDGASCINPTERIDVVKQLTNIALVAGNLNQRDVSFSLYVRNTGTVNLPNVQVSDFLFTTGTAANSQNVAFPTATAAALVGSISVTSPGPNAATVVAANGNTTNFNGQGTANTAGTVTDANKAALLNTGAAQVLTPGQRLLITYTVRLTFPAGSVPTATQYNTAYASNSTSSNPGSRQLAANGVILPPDDLTAYDASTNGTTYAAQREVGPIDSPVPTPVNFSPSISGTVFEDVNYGGGSGRTLAASGGVGRPGVRVELYDAAGAYVSTTTTDTNGNYTFTNLTVSATTTTSYTVRVLSNQVTSSRFGSVAGLLAVQTYRYNDTERVGGEYPARTEAANGASGTTLSSLSPTTGTTAAQSIVTVALPIASTTGVTASTGVDFGYNFDTVVNTNASGQGSLQQFLLNSNTLGGESTLTQKGSRVDATGTTVLLAAGTETSIFMIPDGKTHGGLTAYNATTNPGLISQLEGRSTSGTTNGTGGTVALITATTAGGTLSIKGTSTATAVYAANTALDGGTQTANVGDTNAGNAADATTVGVEGIALAAVPRPEVEIQTSALTTLLDVEATSATVRGLALHGSNGDTNYTNSQTILVGNSASADGYLLENLLVGTTTTGARPTTAGVTSDLGISVLGSAGVGTVQNSLIGYTNGTGLRLNNGLTTTGTTQVTGNFFLKTGFLLGTGEGLAIGDVAATGAGAVNVLGNSFANTNASGISFEIGSTTASTVTNNTITGAGLVGDAGSVTSAVEGSGIAYIQRDGSKRGSQADVLSKNVVTNSQNAGIVVGYGQQNVTISQNSTSGNGAAGASAVSSLGIDLIGSASSGQYYPGSGSTVGSANYGNGDGVTLNDGNDPAQATTNLANRGTDFPVIYTATTSTTAAGTVLTVIGSSRPGAAIEFFIRDNDANGFGEGQTYLTTLTEGSPDDASSAAGAYNGSTTSVNGANPGSDSGANQFRFTISLAGLSSAQLASLTANGLTATATLSNSTSEFSAKAPVNSAPVPNTVTNVNVPNNNPASALNAGLSATTTGFANGTATANSVAYYTLTSLPASGTLTYNGTVLTSSNIAATQISNLSQLLYTPVTSFSGSVSFQYTATDANGITSTTSKAADGSIVSGPATYTIPVTQSADVTVSITGATTLLAGKPTGNYTVTFTNEGPQQATSVTRVVTLPTGATLSTDQRTAAQAAGATVGTNSSGNVTLTYGNGTLTLDNHASSQVTVAFTAPSATSTTLLLTAATSAAAQGANLAPDQASLTLTTTAVADATASVSMTNTTTTGTVSFSFGNNGPLAADGIVPTVQLPANLPGYTTSTGWNYTPATGLVTYTGATTSISNGGTLAGTLTYNLSGAPVAPVTAVASITTTTDEAGQRANNVAQVSQGSLFDLTTSLSGPASVDKALDAVAGAPMTLLVTTTNRGPNVAPDATQVVDIPSAATLAGSIFMSNGGTYSYNTGTKVGRVTFPTLTNVPAGQTMSNYISFLTPTANFVPSATVSSTATQLRTDNDVAYLNGAASSTNQTVVTSTDVINEATSITATVGSAPATIVAPGATLVYKVTSTNKGGAGNGASTTVTQKVQLLPGLTDATLKVGNTTGAYSGSLLNFYTSSLSNYDPATGVLTFYQVTQAPGVTTTYDDIAITVPSAVGNDGQLMATAVVSTDRKDNVPADNIATVGVRVQTTPDVATTITGPASTVAGLPASYVVKFVNNGATAATGVTESVQLPAGLSSVSILDAAGAAVTGASYSSTTGLVTLPALTTPVTLAAGAQQQFTIVLTAPAQNFPVSSAVASTSPDGVSSNNAATLLTAVTANGDLAVSISGPPTAIVGNVVTYTITTTNNGPTVATTVVPKVALPTGLTALSSGPGGAATVATSGSIDTYTFGTVAALPPGASVVNYLNVTMPASPTNGQLVAQASVTSATADQVASNNTAGLTTSLDPATTAVADLATSISLTTPSGATSVTAGTALTYTLGYRNVLETAGAGATALNVVPTANLPANLTATDLKVGNVSGTLANGVITFSSGPASGATYNVASGLLTFPTIASAPAQTAPNASYTVAFTAPPSSGQLVVTAQVSAATTDNVTSNNFRASSITINSAFDVATTLSGPVSSTAQPGTPMSFTVTTRNNGPTAAPGTTSQKVSGLPGGLTNTQLQVDGLTGTGSGVITFSRSGVQVASYDSGNGILTLADMTSLPAGFANAVLHSFTFPMPTTGNVTLSAVVTNTNGSSVVDSNPGNNTTSNLVITPANIAPVAQNVWNSLQSARGNTANDGTAKGLLISPLNGTDADGNSTLATYTLTTVPPSSQGALYLNAAGTALAAGATLTTSQASQLTFAPNSSYVGDATFTYTVTDNGNGTAANALTSPTAIYTIMVAQDQSTTYKTYNTAKGGSGTKYANQDILAQLIDPNTAQYNSAGAVYDSSTGALLTGGANGLALTGTNVTLVTGTLPTGVDYDRATGRIYVSDATKLPRITAATDYPLTFQTTDLNGGTNQVPVTLRLGAFPLPVQLVAFTAQAVQNRDGLLKWTTASELDNDHFEVERSLDGVRYAKLAEVKGQGSKAGATDYAFTDAGIGPKVTAGQPVYYRLRQVDLNGASTYSPVRTVSFSAGAAGALTLAPNPASAATSLDLSALPTTGTYQVLLLDATGRQVRTLTLGGGLVQRLDLADVASGTYQVLVSGQQADGSALRQILRLVKD